MLTPFKKVLTLLRPLNEQEAKIALRLLWNSKKLLQYLYDIHSIPNEITYHYLTIAMYDYYEPNEIEQVSSLNQERMKQLTEAIGIKYINPYLKKQN